MIGTASIIAPTVPVEQELRWLDKLLDNATAYARLWRTCAIETGADVAARNGKLLAEWPVDDRHIERGEHLKILTTHMDDAGHRPAVLKLLETTRWPASS